MEYKIKAEIESEYGLSNIHVVLVIINKVCITSLSTSGHLQGYSCA